MNMDVTETVNELVSVKGLKVHFPIRGGFLGRPVGWVKAVDGVDFHIAPGETLSLVGESGCGKSTTGYALLGMIPSTAGGIYFEGQALDKAARPEACENARRQMQIVFQDPYSSLDPKMSVGESIAEPLRARGVPEDERRERMLELLRTVGLHPGQHSRLPGQFSGGQRQRLVIARALALRPKLIVCDEPVSALDVSIRSQILNLLMELQAELNLSYLFISHDLSVVRHISDRVAVMYLGTIVETGKRDELLADPLHPYTEALLSAIPLPDPVLQRQRKRIILEGDIPSPANPPRGCPLVTRCPERVEICREMRPELREIRPGHFAACHVRRSG